MKSLLLTFSLLLSTHAFGESLNLSYKETVKVKRTIMQNTLPENLIKLQRALKHDDKRMIAGDFESKNKKSVKDSYVDSLRSKLEGCKGFNRF